MRRKDGSQDQAQGEKLTLDLKEDLQIQLGKVDPDSESDCVASIIKQALSTELWIRIH